MAAENGPTGADISIFRIAREKVTDKGREIEELQGSTGRLATHLSRIMEDMGYANIKATILKTGEIESHLEMTRDPDGETLVVEINDEGLNVERQQPKGFVYRWDPDTDNPELEALVHYRPLLVGELFVRDPKNIHVGQPMILVEVSKTDATSVIALDEGSVTFVVEDNEVIKRGQILFYIEPNEV